MRKGIQYICDVECALERSGQFLLIQRPKNSAAAAGLLSLPGGGVEVMDGKPDENILANAVKREICEELGLELVDPVNYITTNYFKDDFGNNVMCTVFYCRLHDTKADIKPAAEEVEAYQWLTYEEIMKAPNSPPWLKQHMIRVMDSAERGYEIYKVRLPEKDLAAIKESFQQCFTREDHLWIFGSRVEPNRRGGDIDLYVETKELDVDIIFKQKQNFVRELQHRIGDQKIDVVLHLLKDRYTLPIYEVARTHGVMLV